jgi:hypothetical protein
MKLRTSVAGTDEFTTSTIGEVDTTDTGAKSFTGS